MGARIKVIHWLTIVALVALVAVQGYWLFNQYVYTLKQYEDELFERTIAVSKKDRDLRKELHDKRFQVMTQWRMEAMQGDTSLFDPGLEWVFDAYIIDKNEMNQFDSISLQQVDSLAGIGQGVKKHRFELKVPGREHDVYDALERFLINELCPFSIGRFDSLLREQGLTALSVKTKVADSMVWSPRKTSFASTWYPITEVTYPFNILQHEQVSVTYKLVGSPMLGRMLESLLCSIVLAMLLVFCLIYQLKTIFRQQRVDELRKDFVKTMIHELKRPVATLKMCISFMKNDRMMQDRMMKEDIILSSQKELDNLSSYFSKLRDLTYGDMDEIPLNLSTFNIKRAVEECIEKQHLPGDREVGIKACFDNDNGKITADSMHISNIILNLLENAVKYSEGQTSILVDCRSAGDNYVIKVSDDGLGIPPSECPYVFDKFFRSPGITEKNIPGIGLGLSYVKLLVVAHKGKISLESTLGVGSKFIIEIPKKQGDERKKNIVGR